MRQQFRCYVVDGGMFIKIETPAAGRGYLFIRFLNTSNVPVAEMQCLVYGGKNYDLFNVTQLCLAVDPSLKECA